MSLSLLLIVFLIFCSHKVSGQDTQAYSVVDTALQSNSHNSHYLKPVTWIIPGTLLVYGALKPIVSGIQQLDSNIMTEVKKNHGDFHTNAADYIMWAPSASIYLMDAFKVNTKHSFQEHLLLDAGSLIVTGGIGYVMRKVTGNIKEYNMLGTKFPSGHTANAFRGAEIVHQELKDKHALLSYCGYLPAITVGVLRIYDKDHLLTEVLAGAGLGILSTKLTYWLFEKTKLLKKRN